MNNRFFNFNLLSPTGYIGFWVLLIGLVFTGIIFYYVFLKLNEDDNSFTYRNKKNLEKEKQKERIARLYPKEN